MPIHADPFVAQ
jgi:hypothetical protein